MSAQSAGEKLENREIKEFKVGKKTQRTGTPKPLTSTPKKVKWPKQKACGDWKKTVISVLVTRPGVNDHF